MGFALCSLAGLRCGMNFVRGRGLVGIVGENKLCMRKKFSLKNIVICAQIFFCKVVVFVYGAKGVHVL